jgi:uncharacterized protein
MTLEEKINKDLTESMKSGDRFRTETIRSIRAIIIEYNKRGINRTITPDDEISILSTAAKQRREAIEEYNKANRQDLSEKEEKELAIISGYLPKALTIEEVKETINKIINDTGAQSMKDFGKVMPNAMKELKGRADGKVVQDLVKELLSK